MKPFRYLYLTARLVVMIVFLTGIVIALANGAATSMSATLLVTGMAILGLTPIFGLAIVGTTWLRKSSADIAGWTALLLAVFTAYLWFGA